MVDVEGEAGSPPRGKVKTGHGYSQMHWMRLMVSGLNLNGLNGAEPGVVTKEELELHDGSDDGDIWMAVRGKVYNVSPYLKYHPGGPKQLMRAAGQDGTAFFNKYHKWVNVEAMLETCLVGVLEKEDKGKARKGIATGFFSKR